MMQHIKRWLLLIGGSVLLAAAISSFGPHFFYPVPYARHVFDQIALPEQTTQLAEADTRYRNRETMPGLGCSGQAIVLHRTYTTSLQPEELARFYAASLRDNGWRVQEVASNTINMHVSRSLATIITPRSGISLHLWFKPPELIGSGDGKVFAEEGIYFITLEYSPVRFYCSD